MENEHNMNTKLNEKNDTNAKTVAATEPNKLIKLDYGGAPWHYVVIIANPDLSNVVGHFDFAGTFSKPQLLMNGTYDQAAIELLKHKGVEFYIVQGAELQDWGHLGTVLTDEQSALREHPDGSQLEMNDLLSVFVTDLEDSSDEEPEPEPETESSDDEERPSEYVMNGKDAKEYLGMDIADDELEDIFRFEFEFWSSSGQVLVEFCPEWCFNVTWTCIDSDTTRDFDGQTGTKEMVNGSSGFSLMMCGWEFDP